MDTRIKKVVFNAEEHSYFYEGKLLHGITGTIGKIMGKVFPENDIVMLATMYGHTIHSESEDWIKSERPPSTEGGKWLIQELKNIQAELSIGKFEAEVLVSDFEGTASAVDIVAHTKEGAYLFDIKTTSKFDREYCSRQLSVYKYLYEKVYEEKVLGLFVLATKSERRFRILEQDFARTEKVLNMNKEVS